LNSPGRRTRQLRPRETCARDAEREPNPARLDALDHQESLAWDECELQWARLRADREAIAEERRFRMAVFKRTARRVDTVLVVSLVVLLCNLFVAGDHPGPGVIVALSMLSVVALRMQRVPISR
jgi:hypothetical protein